MNDIKKLLEIRKNRRTKRHHFRRQGYGIYHRIKDQWRKPKGRHSKQRHQAAGHAKIVKPGFRTNKLIRGMDKTGLIPVLVNSMAHIPLLDKNVHGAVICGNVGDRKRLHLLLELKKHGIKVLNLKENHDKTISGRIEERKKERAERLERKSKKKSKKEVKKEEKKQEKELTPEEKEAKEKAEKDKLLTKEIK